MCKRNISQILQLLKLESLINYDPAGEFIGGIQPPTQVYFIIKVIINKYIANAMVSSGPTKFSNILSI